MIIRRYGWLGTLGCLALSLGVACSEEHPFPEGSGGAAGAELGAGGAPTEGMAGGVGTQGGSKMGGGGEDDGASVAGSGAQSGIGGDGATGCDGTLLDCDGSGECKIDGSTDKDHCGGCDTSCAQQCRAGTCADPLKVSVGFTHVCALLSDGSVWCWGSNFWGELGPGHPDGATAPVRVDLPQKAIDVAAGGTSREQGDPLAVSCAVLADETVRCWGAGTAGGLGNGSTESSSAPVEVKGVTNASSVALGAGHGCAVTGVGKLYCWGLNHEGQVGNGSKTNAAEPAAVLTGVTQVAPGGSHTCALKSNGDVFCWGRSSSGQLGIANLPSNTSTPLEVPGLNDSDEVAAGISHSCARRGTTVRCWGHDYAGEVNATFSNVETPVEVDIDDNPPPAKHVTLGADISAVIGTDDVLTVWGATFHGDGQGSTGYTPQKIEVGPVAFASFGQNFNDEHTVCVIKANRELRCWGGDSYGQVGNGDPVAEVREPAVVTFED
jgi:alpha-tubulin suppressor-like RCC1 family protein